MTHLFDVWTFAVATVGVTATLLLGLYVVALAWLLVVAVRDLWARLHYRILVKRRLRQLHAMKYAHVVSLASRAERRRIERGGHDAA